MITGRKPTDFTALNSLVGDEKFYTQSLTDSFQTTLPAIGDYMETYINGDKTQQQGTYLVSGGRVVWVEDLKFTVTSAVYLINGIRYTSEEQEVTLTTADPSNPRIDTFYLDVNSQFGAIAGTPAATPAEPSINPETQIRLTIATINAGATTPAGITNEIIYNENLQVAGGEWDTSVNVLGYSTFEDTADPAKDSKSIKTSIFEINTLTLRFTNNANINLSDYDSLVLRVRQRGRAASNQGVTLYWSDSIGNSYSFLPSLYLRPGTFGFTVPNEEWQTIVIPIASFNPYEANRIASRLSIGIASRSGTLMWEFDDIYLQAGIKQNIIDPVEVKVGKTLFVDTVYGDDTTAERENFIKPFRTAAAAEAQAVSGDTIVFRPGTHLGTNLGKDGVTYYISPNATLLASSGRMFTDNGKGAMTVTVICDGTLSATVASFCYITQASAFYFKIEKAVKNTQTPPNELFQITNGSASLYVKFTSIVNNSTNPWYVFADSAPGCKYYVEGNYCFTTSNFADIDGEGVFRINRLEATFNNANEILVNASGNNRVYCEFNYVTIVGTNGSIARANNGGNIIIKNSYIVYSITAPSYAPINAYSNGYIDIYNSTIIYDNTAGTRPLIGYYAGGNNTNAFFKLYNCQLIHKGQLVTSEGLLLNSGTSPASGNVILSNTQILLDSTAVGLGAKAIDAGAASLSYRMFTDTLSNGAFDGTNLIASTAAIVDPNVKSD